MNEGCAEGRSTETEDRPAEPPPAHALVQKLQWRMMRYLSAFVLLRIPGAVVQLCNLLWPDTSYSSGASSATDDALWRSLAMLNIVATGSMGTVNALVYASNQGARCTSFVKVRVPRTLPSRVFRSSSRDSPSSG